MLGLVASLAAGDAIEIAVNKAAPIYECPDGGELIAKGLVDPNQCIDDLYQLLPTIRMIRRGAQLGATNRTQTPVQEPTGLTEQLLQTGKILSSQVAMPKPTNSSIVPRQEDHGERSWRGSASIGKVRQVCSETPTESGRQHDSLEFYTGPWEEERQIH